MMETQPHCITIEAEDQGQRLDAFLAARFPRFSRVQLRRSINSVGVTVDGQRAKAAHRLKTGQVVQVTDFPEPVRETVTPEEIPLDILYEDDWLVAVNKPPRMVVHPGRGNWSGALTNALAFHFEQLSSVGGAARPGIVHRLDRDTSGVIVIAKTDEAHLALSAQFQERTLEKEYFALVAGVPDRDRDWIERPIGAHPYQREKMAIRDGHSTSRHAATFYEVQERLRGFSAVKAFPKTGRTHQIRVHLGHVGHPVLCDKLYSGRSQITVGELRDGREQGEVILSRQALHARRIQFAHPEDGREMELTAPLPEDLQKTWDQLRELA